jgi:hypothetical protein
MNGVRLAASAIVALAFTTPALAQGKGKGKDNTPPSRSDLSSSAGVSGVGATPFAWIDDASTVEPGSVWISASGLTWHGNGASEFDAPIVDAAIGLAPRVQLTASVPTSLGSGDPTGAAGGIGTAYFSAKIGVFQRKDRRLKVAVSPTLEVLSRGVLDSIGPGQRRAHWGAPVSAQFDRGRLRAYTGVGYFSRGVWFSGGGASFQARRKVFVSGTLSRSWRRDESGLVPIGERRRTDISGTISYVLRPQITASGSFGRTIMTLPQNGAGTSVSGGVSVFLPARHR